MADATRDRYKVVSYWIDEEDDANASVSLEPFSDLHPGVWAPMHHDKWWRSKVDLHRSIEITRANDLKAYLVTLASGGAPQDSIVQIPGPDIVVEPALDDPDLAAEVERIGSEQGVDSWEAVRQLAVEGARARRAAREVQCVRDRIAARIKGEEASTSAEGLSSAESERLIRSFRLGDEDYE